MAYSATRLKPQCGEDNGVVWSTIPLWELETGLLSFVRGQRPFSFKGKQKALACTMDSSTQFGSFHLVLSGQRGTQHLTTCIFLHHFFSASFAAQC
jgi:hypothetical protein